MKKDSKKRLFEVMQRVAPNFTGKALNENQIYPVDAVRKNPDLMTNFRNGYLIPVFNAGEKTAFGFIDAPEEYQGGGNVKAVKELNGQIKFVKGQELQEEDFEQETTSEFLPITTPVGSPDDKLFTDIVNQGIDSHLEGFTKSKFEIKNASTGNRKVFNFHKSEIPILVRRLQELGTPEADQWADDIENYDKNVQEIAENL